MEVLDFTYWNQLFESELTYYSFTIPDKLSYINEEYKKILTSILEQESTFFDAKISSSNTMSITVLFEMKHDELSIFTKPSPFMIYFNLPGSINLSINKKTLINSLNKVSGNRLIDKNSETVIVSKTKDPASLIREIAIAFLRLSSEPSLPSDEEILEAFILPESEHRNQKVNSLSKKFNIFVQYHTLLKILSDFLNGSEVPDIEKISIDINNKLNKIKNLDISSGEKDKNILEILEFYKYLLSKSHIYNIEKEEVLPALIEVSRILLSELGSITEIKKKLSAISS